MPGPITITSPTKKTAEEVAAEVQALLERTGASSVDIITHSMGSLSSRYYAKFLNGDENIDAWVSLAGANHGTNWAYGCLSWSCFEMRPGSNFLSELNKGNETPGICVTQPGGRPAIRS